MERNVPDGEVAVNDLTVVQQRPATFTLKSAAFEVRRLSDSAMMAVHVNGRIEGFPPDYTVIVNRIPFMLSAARLEGAPAPAEPAEPEPLGPAEWRDPAFLEELANKALARIATLEAQNARLLQQVADLEAVRGVVPFRATAEPAVTPEMIEAANRAWHTVASDTQGDMAQAYAAVYRAMRALEPVMAAPGLTARDPLGPHLTALRGLP